MVWVGLSEFLTVFCQFLMEETGKNCQKTLFLPVHTQPMYCLSFMLAQLHEHIFHSDTLKTL